MVIIFVKLDPLVKKQLTKILKQDGVGSRSFNERGGTLFGFFNGEKLLITEAIEDEHAVRTNATIKFSYEHYQDANVRDFWYKRLNDQIQNNCYLGRIGTWHTHPPGYGAHYSSTDQKSLFLEYMILSTDDPSSGIIPRVHLIGCNSGSIMIKAYILEIGANFDYIETDNINVSTEIDSNLALLIRENDTIYERDYYPWFFETALENDTLEGIRILFNYDNAPKRLEKLVFENFFLKIPKEKRSRSYRYIRKLNNKIEDHFMISRTPSEKRAWKHVEIDWT